MVKFIVITQEINSTDGPADFYWDGVWHATRVGAINFGWMDRQLDYDLDEIAHQIGIGLHPWPRESK